MAYDSDNGSYAGCIVIGLIIVGLLVVAWLVGITDPKTAARILDTEGVTNVHFTGYDLWACGNDDWYHTGFTGMQNGKPVKGVVCSGLLFKASTVRYH